MSKSSLTSSSVSLTAYISFTLVIPPLAYRPIPQFLCNTVRGAMAWRLELWNRKVWLPLVQCLLPHISNYKQVLANSILRGVGVGLRINPAMDQDPSWGSRSKCFKSPNNHEATKGSSRLNPLDGYRQPLYNRKSWRHRYYVPKGFSITEPHISIVLPYNSYF